MDVPDPWIDRMRGCPTTVVSSTLQGPFDWPDASVVSGDAVETVRRMKEESDVPIRSNGSLSVNRALLAAGLVDRIQVTVFPVVSAQTGDEPVFAGMGDLDTDLLKTRTLDGRTQQMVHRPTPHLASRLTQPPADDAADGASLRRVEGGDLVG
jgi:dihydrofolate reductase